MIHYTLFITFKDGNYIFMFSFSVSAEAIKGAGSFSPHRRTTAAVEELTHHPSSLFDFTREYFKFQGDHFRINLLDSHESNFCQVQDCLKSLRCYPGN